MQVRDVFGLHDVEDADGLAAALSKRRDDRFNEFWIAEVDGALPSLAILVNGDLATVFYFPDGERDHPGFRSVGRLATLDQAGTTDFLTGHDNELLPSPNTFVIEISDAMRAAQEFLVRPQMPRSLEWFEL